MSSCNPELVSAYLDGELDGIIVKTVTKHLLKCESCQQLLGVLAGVRSSVKDHFRAVEASPKDGSSSDSSDYIGPVLEDSEGLTSSIMDAIGNADDPNSAKVSTLTTINTQWLRYAGISLATAAAISVWMDFGSTGDQESNVAHQLNQDPVLTASENKTNFTPSPYSSSTSRQTVGLVDGLTIRAGFDQQEAVPGLMPAGFPKENGKR